MLCITFTVWTARFGVTALCGSIGLLDHMFMIVSGGLVACDGLRCGLVCSGEIIVHMMLFLCWMDRVIGGQGSDRLHGSVDKMIGQWENDGVKMIGVADHDGLNDKEEDDMIQAHDISDKVGAVRVLRI